eukprot:5224950-Pleurochrysis_carterae.AAC.1
MMRQAPLADDIERPEQPTLANTPGTDCCSTPTSAAAMHANPTPRTTRVTRTAHGSGARPIVGGVLVALHFAFM